MGKPSSFARWAGPAGIAIVLGAGWAACSSNGATSASSAASTSSTSAASTSSGTGGEAGKDAGGGGGASHLVCVSTPAPAPFGGTSQCPAPLPSASDALDAALAKGGISRCDVHLFVQDMLASGEPGYIIQDPHQLPDFAALQEGPLRLPGYARETAAFLDAAVASKNPVSATIAALSVRRGHRFSSSCVDLEPFAAAPGDATPLATAVLLLDTHQGTPGNAASVQAAAAAVPIGLQTKLALVIGAIDHAATEVKAALGTSDPKVIAYLAQGYALYLPQYAAFSTTYTDLHQLDAVDVGRMAQAAALLAKTIEDADFPAEPAATFAPFEVGTPLGEIVVHDAANDVYGNKGPAENAVLLFDLGGDDVYEVPAGASNATHPVSIAIDVRGKDTYKYQVVPDPQDTGLLPSDGAGRYVGQGITVDDGPITFSRTSRQGAGVTGIGMLFDLGPEGDSYQSLAVSQGFAQTGVGVLYDAGGDDTYAAEAASQGAAIYGIAALIDVSGNDTYNTFYASQGFGGTEGVGALVDGAGDDVYYCDPGDPTMGGHTLYFSPQLPGMANDTMGQGAGLGIRDSTETAPYFAGGLGVLRDVSGKDKYTGGVFSTGVAYYQGIGLFLEGAGDDTYDALWYTQGSTAHFGLSVFLEQGGDDTYNLEVTPSSTSIGVGHDFSASLHIDEGGDDKYNAPNLSLGSGNINGIGFLVNLGGNDSFVAAGDPTLGAGNYSNESTFTDPRASVATIGIFVHTGGTATYQVAGAMRPLAGTTWSYDPQPFAPMMLTHEFGCGADDPNGAVTLP